MKKHSFLSVLLAVCMIFAMFSLTGCSSKTIIDLSKCVSMTFSGYNGKGVAEATIDSSYILSLLGDKNELTASAVANSFSIGFINNNGTLSNGDIITIKVKTDDKTLINADVMATNTELSFTVEGLKEKPVVDVFADVSVKISGISPYCTVKVEYKGMDLLYNGSFIVKSSTGEDKKYFKNGDKFTVSIDENAISTLERTKTVKEKSREYTVECESSYILSASDMTAEQKSKLDKIAEDFMNEQMEILRTNADRDKRNDLVACASGLNKGSLYAMSNGVTDIQNIKFNSAYVGEIKEQGSFGTTKNNIYAYYFYDFDVSYIVKDFFKDITGTTSCIFVVRFTEPQISSGKLSYSKIEMDCDKDFETTTSKRGLASLEKFE